MALGVAHFLVDASSNFIMARLLGACAASKVVLLLVAYNFLAFALQAPIGFATDRWRAPRPAMCVGLLLAATAMLVLGQAMWIPLVLTAVGNALFHVGGGTIASLATWRRASGPGLFIAPGAIGVVLGAAAGRSLPAAFTPILVGLLVAAPLGTLLRTTAVRVAVARPTGGRPAVVLALLLFAIAGRSLLGARLGGQLSQTLGIGLPLAIAAFSGKALGGLVGDRVGWTRTAVVAMILSSLLLLVGRHTSWAAVGSMLFFQAVTSITLTALYLVLPTRVGLAFGLASLSLFVGSLPVLFGLDLTLGGPVPFDSLLALLTTVAAWRALTLLDRSATLK
jgi:MFS transporter, FSR family, fosmidomycin resistance protein